MVKSHDFDEYNFAPFDSGTVKLNAKEPTISVRTGGIAFNQAFLEIALEHGPAAEYWVDVQADQERECLGLKFYHEAQRSILAETDWPLVQRLYQLTGDGGKVTRKHRGRQVALRRTAGCGKIVKKTPWLAAIASIPDPQLRRFRPTWSAKHKLWAIPMSKDARVSPGELFPSSDHRGGR